MHEAESPRSVIVGEEFGVSPPADGRPQRPLGLAPRQVILQFVLEPCPWRLMILPLIEHLPNMRDQRDETNEMLAEEAFAFFHPALNEKASCRRQCDRAVLEFGELEDM